MFRRLLIMARWIFFLICCIYLQATRKRQNREPVEHSYEGENSSTYLNHENIVMLLYPIHFFKIKFSNAKVMHSDMSYVC